MNEKPLEIALDCCTQGKVAPTFHLKSLHVKKPLESSDASYVETRHICNGSPKVQRESPHPLCHTTSSPPSGTPMSTSSPLTSHKHTHGKWAVSDIITRSLRVRKKPKITTGSLPSNKQQAFTLVSPLPAEKQFTMSTVMHIYYRSSTNELYCKGVLVSEKSLTKEVITQALERFDLKFCDPQHFGLYEVIGKWEEVNCEGGRNNGKVLSSDRQHSKQASNSKQVTEEFAVCFERELHSSESPYNSQFYFEPSNGYSRRFELRKKEHADGKVTLPSSVSKKSKVAAEPSIAADVLPAPKAAAGVVSLGMYSAHLGTPFVLFLRLYDRKKELLVHRLDTEQTYFTCATDTSSACSVDSNQGNGKLECKISKIELSSPEFSHEKNAICIISKRPLNGCVTSEDKCQHSLEVVGHGYDVTVNGSVIEKSTVLQFGDLVAIGQCYIFIFYDCVSDMPQSKYTWEEKLLTCSQTHGATLMNRAAAMQHCSTPIPHDLLTSSHPVTVSPFTCKDISPTTAPVPVFTFSSTESDAVEDSPNTLHDSSDGLHSSADGFHGSTGALHTKLFDHSNKECAEDQILKTHSSLFDSDAKEDLAITGVTERFDVASATMKLLPAYILATCVRHQLRTRGAAAATVSVNKASQGLQVVLWVCGVSSCIALCLI